MRVESRDRLAASGVRVGLRANLRVGVCAWAGVLALAGAARAQSIIYTAGAEDAGPVPLSTGFKTKAGGKAPTGAFWSELQAEGRTTQANALAGVSVHDGVAGGAFRAADAFTVPAGQVWQITGVRVFVYQTGGSATASPVDGFNFRILSGVPGQGGTVAIFGDDATSRLGAMTFTNIYRQFATGPKGGRPAPSTARPIWRIESSTIDVALPAGTYWLDFQLSSLNPDAGLFAPLITTAGTRGGAEPDAALHLAPLGVSAQWREIEDPGIGVLSRPVPQRLPIQLVGQVLNARSADIASAVGEAGRDGAVGQGDLLAFMDAYVKGELLADLCGDGGLGTTPDGKVTPADLVAFISAYANEAEE